MRYTGHLVETRTAARVLSIVLVARVAISIPLAIAGAALIVLNT